MVLNAVMETLTSALNPASVNYGNEQWGVADRGQNAFPPTVVDMLHADLGSMTTHAQRLFVVASDGQVEGQQGTATVTPASLPAIRPGANGPAESVRTEAAAAPSGRDAFARALVPSLSTPHALPHSGWPEGGAADQGSDGWIVIEPQGTSPTSRPSPIRRGYRFGDVTRSVVRRTRDWHQTRQERRERSRSQPPMAPGAGQGDDYVLPETPTLLGRQLSDGGRQILRDQLSRCLRAGVPSTFTRYSQ